MKKRGGLLVIILSTVIVILLLVLGAGYYFYEIHTFKTIRLCIGRPIEFEIVCSTKEDCVDYAKGLGVDFSEVDLLPEFLRLKLDELLDKSLSCNNNCVLRNLRGFNIEERSIEELDFCLVDEEEFLIEVNGREAIEFYKFLKK